MCWEWGRGGGPNKFVGTATGARCVCIVWSLLVAVELQELTFGVMGALAEVWCLGKLHPRLSRTYPLKLFLETR